MLFQESLEFTNFVGKINLFGRTYFNNISYYLEESIGKRVGIVARNWGQVYEDEDPPTTYDWQYWKDSGTYINGVWKDATWRDVYVLNQTTTYILTPENIYQLGLIGNVVTKVKTLSVFLKKFFKNMMHPMMRKKVAQDSSGHWAKNNSNLMLTD
jgi:hypothetical protein